MKPITLRVPDYMYAWITQTALAERRNIQGQLMFMLDGLYASAHPNEPAPLGNGEALPTFRNAKEASHVREIG